MSTVLLVEDDEIVRFAMEGVLAAGGHEVHVVSNGDDAIRIAADHAPDVLITDWRLPGERDGLHVARELRDRFPSLVILVQSGFPPEEILARSKGLPISRVLNKPVPLATLLDLVEEATRGNHR